MAGIESDIRLRMDMLYDLEQSDDIINRASLMICGMARNTEDAKLLLNALGLSLKKADTNEPHDV